MASLSPPAFLLLVVLAVIPTSTLSSNHNLRHNEDSTVIENRKLLVNGEDAIPGEFPWFVSMLRESEDEAPACGGTLIAPNRVLTAAHCMVSNFWLPELGPPAYVRIGHTTHTDGKVYPVDCVSIHPNYVPLYNDLAIVKLSVNVTDTPYVTLNSNTSYPSTNNQQLTAVGFGATSTWMAVVGTIMRLGRIPKSSHLQKLATKFFTETSCRTRFRCADTKYYTCAMPERESAGACYGDSGGPLVDANNVQVGIVAFKAGKGIACAQGFPDIHVNVAEYYDWIESEVAVDYCNDYASRGPDPAFEPPCS